MKAAINYLLLLLYLLIPQLSHAFYSGQSDAASLQLSGFVRGSFITLNNPDNPLFFNRKNVSDAALSGRMMLDAGMGDLFTFEAHAIQNYVPLALQTGGSRFISVQGVERSDLLDWSYSSGRAHLLLDRLNVQLATESLNLKIGRQPVNLAATFFFTPNDFFAPFAAQTFFRSYKPGVDALRADIQMTEFSQLSLIAVLGYSADLNGDNGWSNRIDTARNAHLGRVSTVFADFELALLAGTVRKDTIAGIDFQGELFDWLGVRGEGHMLFPDAAGVSNSVEFSLGLEHRWENSFTARVEQFYHGGGATDVTAYAIAGGVHGFYQARHYTAAGFSYEFTPLLTGDATLIYNWVDQSSLLALYALYSLSDESELAVSGSLTSGRKPVGAAVRSEFGMFPDAVSIEYRAYF